MKNGMKRTLAALALCAAVTASIFADAKSDALLRATDDNNVAEALRLIKAGADLKATNWDGENALMIAAQNNSADIAKALIAAGADVNAQIPIEYGVSGGETPLIFAAYSNAVEVAKLLIAAGADVNKRSHADTPLTAATGSEAWEVAKLLIAAKADVNIDPEINNVNTTPLMEAARYNAVDIMKLLIKAGAKLNVQRMDTMGYRSMTALMYAAEKNAIDAARLLIASGADVNIRSSIGATALYMAVTRNHPELVDILIAAGANVNENNIGIVDVGSILMHAASIHLPAIIKKLVAAGADVNLRQHNGQTALMWAVLECDNMGKNRGNVVETIQVLLDAGADINAISRYTALMYAAKEKKLDAAKALIAAGADVNMRSDDYDGRTALMLAARLSGKTGENIVQALIAAGADVNAKDKNGKSVIEYAKDATVKKLLKKASVAQTKNTSKEKDFRQVEDEYQKNSANEEAMHWINIHDKSRDEIYDDLKKIVEQWTNFPSEAISKPSKVLSQCLKDNTVDTNLSFDKKTDLYTSLIKDLEGKYAAQVKKLNLGMPVANLKKLNEEVRKLTKQLK